MTLDDLALVFEAACFKYNDAHPECSPDDLERAGIRAVVAALRDEIFDARGNASYGSLAMFDLFNEILGIAAEEAAGGKNPLCTPVDLTIAAYNRGTVFIDNDTQTPAADVCEWTPTKSKGPIIKRF